MSIDRYLNNLSTDLLDTIQSRFIHAGIDEVRDFLAVVHEKLQQENTIRIYSNTDRLLARTKENRAKIFS